VLFHGFGKKILLSVWPMEDTMEQRRSLQRTLKLESSI
jgi:hypothetical protein